MTDQKITSRVEPCICVHASVGYDGGTMFIREGTQKGSAGHMNWFSVSVVSSFGEYGHHFSNIGYGTAVSFMRSMIDGKKFHYFMGKLSDAKDERPDFDSTVDLIRSAICEARRETSLKKEDAREAWEELDDIISDLSPSVDGLMHACHRSSFHLGRVMSNREVYEPAKVDCPQARGFFDVLLPVMLEALERHQLENVSLHAAT